MMHGEDEEMIFRIAIAQLVCAGKAHEVVNNCLPFVDSCFRL
jgi:hypothetical protein